MHRLRLTVLVASIIGVAVASASFAGCGGDDPPLFTGPDVEAMTEPAPGGVRYLLSRQYVNSVRLILGETAAAAAIPPDKQSLHGLKSIGAVHLSVLEGDVEEYETSARAVAQAVVSNPASLEAVLTCSPSGPTDETCYAEVIRERGRLAWRRDLEDAEVAAIVAVAKAAGTEYESFNQGLAYAFSALLQSPYFIYIIELGEPDSSEPGRLKLTAAELATRMSFFLTDTTPDAALLNAAAAGSLDTPDGVRAIANELLERDAARSTMTALHRELFRLDRLDTLTKDPDVFPDFDEALRVSMGTSLLKLIDDIVWDQNGDYRDLLTADYAFVDRRLAQHYGLANEVSASGFEKVSMPAEHKRVGLLGSAAFLSLYSHAKTSSPTLRGLYMRRQIMCDEIPAPPPDVDPTLPEDDPDKPKTTKQKLEAHMENPSCSSCHGLMDPLGFALEHFDATGQYRSKYANGLAIDPSGSSGGLEPFADAAELAQALHADSQTSDCALLKVYRHSMGHLETEGEDAAINDLKVRFKQSGYRLQALLADIIASPAFQYVGEAK